jgi:hypothetical protein
MRLKCSIALARRTARFKIPAHPVLVFIAKIHGLTRFRPRVSPALHIPNINYRRANLHIKKYRGKRSTRTLTRCAIGRLVRVGETPKLHKTEGRVLYAGGLLWAILTTIDTH